MDSFSEYGFQTVIDLKGAKNLWCIYVVAELRPVRFGKHKRHLVKAAESYSDRYGVCRVGELLTLRALKSRGNDA